MGLEVLCRHHPAIIYLLSVGQRRRPLDGSSRCPGLHSSSYPIKETPEGDQSSLARGAIHDAQIHTLVNIESLSIGDSREEASEGYTRDIPAVYLRYTCCIPAIYLRYTYGIPEALPPKGRKD